MGKNEEIFNYLKKCHCREKSSAKNTRRLHFIFKNFSFSLWIENRSHKTHPSLVNGVINFERIPKKKNVIKTCPINHETHLDFEWKLFLFSFISLKTLWHFQKSFSRFYNEPICTFVKFLIKIQFSSYISLSFGFRDEWNVFSVIFREF